MSEKIYPEVLPNSAIYHYKETLYSSLPTFATKKTVIDIDQLGQ